MKNKLLVFLTLAIFGSTSVLVAQDKQEKKEDRYFEINKNIEIFNSIVRELDMLYVDSLELSKTVKTGIDNMLSSLDPYTEYYNEENMNDFKFMTTGEYAGIGSVITYKDGKICIAEPYEGKPAARAGLKAGDLILDIDGKDMTKCDKKEGEPYAQTLNSFVSSNLKGQPGTTISIKVERPGEKKTMTFKVMREIIVIDPVSYAELISPGIGYISHRNTFTDKSAADVKKAVQDLKSKGMKSLIFDLRGNGGGIVDEAIQIINMFVPKGKVIVSTKGRFKQADRVYRTTLEPMDKEIPIVVLIDNNSASASEIVAGAMQDLDRGVLIGQRTYGKGLVQSPREIPFGGSLKVTTSKYFIPSGRCVQELDYSHRNADGSAGRIPDSLTSVFHTEVGREVRDGGGVSPDIKLEEQKVPNITYYLANQHIVFDWVTDWIIRNKAVKSIDGFSISDKDYDSFKEFVKSKDFKYDRISEKSMTSLKEVMEFEGYMKSASEEFKALEAKLIPNLDRDLDIFKEEITDQINREIVKRFFFQKGEYALVLKKDKTVSEAVKVLNDMDHYKNLLSVQKKEDVAVIE